MTQRTAADRAIVSASIRTLDPARPHATAVAFRRGTIVAVGSDADVRAVCDAATEIVDGRGIAVVPGIVDGHIHPFWPDHVAGADLTRCGTPAELPARHAVRAPVAVVDEADTGAHRRPRTPRAVGACARGHDGRCAP